jgi:hypothetical protein
MSGKIMYRRGAHISADARLVSVVHLAVETASGFLRN